MLTSLNMKIVFLFLATTIAFGQSVKDEVEFVVKTQHLDFSAPKSCSFQLEVNGKKLLGSYKLSDHSCKLDESKFVKSNSAAYHQKITKIDYKNATPVAIEADNNGNILKISFSKCFKIIEILKFVLRVIISEVNCTFL